MKPQPKKYSTRFQKQDRSRADRPRTERPRTDRPRFERRREYPNNEPSAPIPKPELLAPAGRAETFFAALDAGADAVYVGIQDFNARMRAPNFALEELSPLISFAHERDKKVYVTLNTLVKERELPDVARVLDSLRKIGPDALIIQDFGVYRLARELTPEIPLHASTQMTIHNLDGALQAQRMGFERVILARELTLEEIRAIRSSCTIELETFVHGALCFSISGQCLFSSYVHGKSANRGRCMQPCRREFARGDKEAAFFSTYDLNAAAILEQLIASGIRSFKIEGRLKPSETITQITRAYRILIDAFPRISRDVVTAARRALDVAIGRAPSTGFYLSQRPDRLVGGNASHAARDLGTALGAGPGKFGVISTHSVKTGDRLRVQVSDKEVPRGFVVRQMFSEGAVMRRSRPGQRIDIVVPFEVPQGARVFKVADTDALIKGAAKRYEKSYASATTPSKTAFRIRFFALDKRSVRIEAKVGADALIIDAPLTWKGTVSLEEASAILRETSSDYPVRLEVELGRFDAAELPLSSQDAAALRDKTLGRIVEAMELQYQRTLQNIASTTAQKTSPKATKVNIVRLRTLDEVAVVREAMGADAGEALFVVPLREVESESFRRARADKELFSSLILSLPQFMFVSEKRVEVAAQFRRALDLGVSFFEVSNPSHFNLIHGSGRRRLRILCGPGIGCMNSQSLRQLREMGVTLSTYSIEADEENLADMLERIDPSSMAIEAFGYAPLFQTRVPRRQLPSGEVRLIEPEKRFTTRSINDITFVIPEEPFSLCDKLERLREKGFGAFLYDLVFTEDAAATLETVLETDKRGALGASAFNFERGLS
jgi:putative protease